MSLRLNKVHFPVTALGPGRRIGIWFQGCSIGCRGCISQDTWAPDDGQEASVEAVMDWCLEAAADGFDGVTVSGGEPFEQRRALAALLDAFAEHRRASRRPFDLLAYSGLPLRTLRARFPDILTKLDAVIAEPFVANRAPGALWRGSRNQTITPLSPLGEARYSVQMAESERPIQLSVDDGRIWYIGVPRPGDFEKLEAAAAQRGLHWRSASWRA